MNRETFKSLWIWINVKSALAKSDIWSLIYTDNSLRRPWLSDIEVNGKPLSMMNVIEEGGLFEGTRIFVIFAILPKTLA